MITDDEGLSQAVEQLVRAYRALAALRTEVLPSSPDWFSLMAEGPLDQIQQLRQEIEEYTGAAIAEKHAAELWLSIEGRGVRQGDGPASVLTALLDALRKGIQLVAEFMTTGQLTTRPTAALKRACDLRVITLKPGSLQVGVRLPEPDQPELWDDGLFKEVRQAAQDYLLVAAWAGSDAGPDSLTRQFPESEKLRLLLNAVKPFVPRPRGDVESITLSGRLVPTDSPIRLHRQVSLRIDQAIDWTTQEQVETHSGDLREIDLDNLTLTLRNAPDPREVRCTFDESLLEIAKEALDRKVLVTGIRRPKEGRRAPAALDIIRLEIIEDQPLDPT